MTLHNAAANDWLSPVHCTPRRHVKANEENEKSHSIRGCCKSQMFTVSLTLFLAALFFTPLSGQSIAQEDTTFTVEADELLEWDQTKGTYSATGNAVAKQANQQIKAEELVASYDPDSESRKLALMVATGAVEYEDNASTAKGDKLTYHIDSERYLIEGAKSFVTGPNGTMRASKSIELCHPPRTRSY